MIAIDKPWEDLVSVTRCPGCKCIIVCFKDDLIMTEERKKNTRITIKEAYATCSRCGERIFHESSMVWDEEENR